MSAQAARRPRPGLVSAERDDDISASKPDQAPIAAEPDGPALGVAGVVICCASAALAGVLEVLLAPFYIGSVLVPIAVVLAIVTNVILPILSRRLVDSVLAAAAPVVVWAVVVIVLSLPRPEGDVLLPGGNGAQLAVSYAILMLGVLAGVITAAVAGRFRPGPVRP